MKETLSNSLIQTNLKNQAIASRPITHSTQREVHKKIRINSQQTTCRKEKPNMISIFAKEKGREQNDKNSVSFISFLDSSVNGEMPKYDRSKMISKIDEVRTHSMMNSANCGFLSQQSKGISDYSPSYSK